MRALILLLLAALPALSCAGEELQLLIISAGDSPRDELQLPLEGDGLRKGFPPTVHELPGGKLLTSWRVELTPTGVGRWDCVVLYTRAVFTSTRMEAKTYTARIEVENGRAPAGCEWAKVRIEAL